MEAAGSVAQHHIHPSCLGSLQGVEQHRAGVSPLVLAHKFAAGPLRPDLQLVRRCGPEGVRRAEEDPLALAFQLIAQFADGRGLAYAVDAADQNDLRRVDRDDAARDAENVFQLRGEERTKFLGSGRGSGTRTGLEAFAQLGRGFDAHVRHNEEFFQFVPEVGGQVAVAGEEGGEPFAELFTGPF